MEQLFTEFTAASAAAWKQRLEKDLKGITFDDLSVTDRNGIRVHPFYTSADVTGHPAPLTCSTDWNICTEINVTDAASARILALDALENGVSGIRFCLNTVVDPAVLLQGIELPYIYSCFVFDAGSAAMAGSVAAYIRDSYPGRNIPSWFCYDAVAEQLQKGLISGLQPWLSFAASVAPYHTCCVEAALYHNAGATSAYELACTLAHVNEYLHVLDENKLPCSDLHISLAADTAFFEQIAKLRALRSLLPLLCKPYTQQPVLHLHVVTSDIYRAPFDRYNNLLRDTIAGMAAVCGGCNSLYIRPFDGQGDTAFSQRMSRNQQLIFKEESYLDRVADIGAGSYYIETLTTEIAEKAWNLFREIEEQGGLLASCSKGILQLQISTQAAQLVQDYKDGKRVLTGVNKFPNAADLPQAVAAVPFSGHGIHPLQLTWQLTHA